VYDHTIIAGPGKGFMQSWSVLHWGVDASGLPWIPVHESPALFPGGAWGVPAVHVIGQNRDGVDEATLGPVSDAVKRLGNKKVTAEIEKMAETKFDGTLLGGATICAERYQKNGAV
jgi:hypothetical protein